MCRILILDDEPFVAETLQLILEDSGETRPHIAHSFDEAVEKVKQAIQKEKPYEVLLIDQRLGPGEDGIEVFKQLRHISPDSDGIIFTGFEEDLESGVRAYEAGAFRYLPKTYNNRELTFVLSALKQWRSEQREHNWQKIFSEMMEGALREKNFHAVANIVIEHSLKLGFERAHLFWTPTHEDVNQDQRLVGITCGGKKCIPNFGGRLYALRDWYEFNHFENVRHAIFLQPKDIDDIRKQMQNMEYIPPAGELVILPLWSGKALLGALTLDHGLVNKTISEHERNLLPFFTRQVALALEHASLYNRIQWDAEESMAISKFGREITPLATSGNLIELLKEVYGKLCEMIEASRLSISLYSEETQELDVYTFTGKEQYENGHKPSVGSLEGYLFTTQEGLVLPHGVQEFAAENAIELTGEIPASWLGIPLRVSGKPIGAITTQHFQGDAPFTEKHKKRLSSLAEQISAAVHIAHSTHNERQETQRLDLLRRASTEMLHVAREDEENLWLTMLTIVTANFGLGFNRAMLFLVNEDHTKLVGKTGIGTENRTSAIQDWEADDHRNYTLDDFLRELQAGALHPTDFEALTETIEIHLNGTSNTFSRVIRTHQREILTGRQAQTRLPPELTQKVKFSNCAILPLQAGKEALGLVIVDNKHNKKSFSEKDLGQLQTVLNYAGLVWETLRESDKSENLIDINYEILSKAGHEALKETIERISQTAKIFTKADWVIICPFKENKEDEFDTTNIGFDGILKYPIETIIKEKPGRNGITAYLRQHAELLIPDTSKKEAKVGNRRADSHEFIRREGVQAVFGIRIDDVYTEKHLGVMYLDYREAREFSDMDIHHARSFASLAAVAISNARRIEEVRQHRQIKAAQDIAETIGTELNLEKTMGAVIEKLHEFFRETHLCILLYSDDEKALKFAPGTLKYYKIRNPDYKKQDTFQLGKVKGSVACRVAQKALLNKEITLEIVPDVNKDPDYLALDPKIKSELCISLMSQKDELLGVLVMERETIAGFKDEDNDFIKTVARQLSIAIERARQSEKLEFKSTVAAQTTWAAEIAHDINNEVGQIRNWAYLIRSQTKESSPLWDYAKKIDESAAVLASVGPWDDQPDQIVELDALVNDIIQKIRRQRNIFISEQLGAPGVYIKVNTTEFQHVFNQLAGNAVRAMVNSSMKKIFVGTQPMDESQVEILFQDFGPGIQKDLRLSIFQRPVTTKGRGGFGLLLVRQMIEDMRGKIKLLPYHKGQGAAFSIQFPVAASLEEMVE